MDVSHQLLVVLHDKDEAQDLAEEMLAAGWVPCTVHRELLAGEDDAEDADWLILVETTPDGLPAIHEQDELEFLADRYGGFVTDAG
ncbi:hypothetical protein NLX83_14335 [Allokutzneria sp. A3M-2-11 16]|uniref:hypothetical protein n=1 Tax=Allokutzneria sp. A3M-2-11 16 TaxID=2962043 RepID=UPI0020B7E323|nr:hypothetical protein [Allokutzneria sp. A3M-2-11 16]MCP3800440.1 hypothetical protein [Allokutzneria sp. A3M-2-11 16]